MHRTLFLGAYDRHNFGDLLFPHLARAMLGKPDALVAGLGASDLRAVHGHLTRPLAEVAVEHGRSSVDIVHVGGEILSCSAWQAAAMLLPPEDAAAAIARLESDDAARLSWVRRTLGVDAQAPYVAGRDLFPGARAIVFCGVGGIDLEHDAAMRDEVCAKLRDADFVGVRDRHTLALLSREGVRAMLMPDPAVLTRELFGPLIAERCAHAECAEVRRAFPHGYLAVQCSADFGDDATLDLIGAQLDRLARRTGRGAVLFRAGAATWHDDLDVYARLRARLTYCPSCVFLSLDIYDICALIAGSAGYLGSSLHGRIVATAYGLPRANLCRPPGEEHGKTAAFAAAWDPRMPGAVPPSEAAAAMMAALAVPAAAREEAGRAAVAECRLAFDAIRAALA